MTMETIKKIALHYGGCITKDIQKITAPDDRIIEVETYIIDLKERN